MNSYTVLDIETGPLHESELTVPTFEPPSNYKTPEAIERNLAEQKAKWASKLALSPLTGKVVAIGMMRFDSQVKADVMLGDEETLLDLFASMFSVPQTVVTWNGNQWDLAFLWKRMWHHDIKPPRWMREGRYWSNLCVDARELWGLGDRQAEGTLEVVGKLFGLPPKLGNGADFAALLATDPEKAKAYVVRDLEITAGIYRRITNA